MADNVPITPGLGEVIAADEVTRNATSEKQQIIKISLGAEGAFDTLVDSGQQARANSVPVTLSTEDIALLDNIESYIDLIESYIDGIEGFINDLESDVDAMAFNVSNLNVYAGNKYLSTIGHGVKTVTTAGTDVALGSSTAIKRVIIQSQTDNTGLIAVGASGVDATEATGTGIVLYAGESVELWTTNLTTVFIDATVSGEGVRYTYFA